MKTIKSITEAEIAEYTKLPTGWQWTRLGEIADNIQYGYTESSTDEPIGPKFLRITDIQNNAVIWKSVPYCKIDDSKKQNYILKDGDLVFARTGATVGKSYLLKGDFPESVFASYLIRVRLLKEVSESFVYNFFQSLIYWKQITEGQVGIGQPNVNGSKLSLLIVPVAPLPEQRAIVSKIEQLFSELDNGIANLKLAQEQLKVYRQAVLKKAFEGELTRKWREHQIDLPDAGDLLEQIRKEREEAAKTSGKKLKQVSSLTEAELAELPRLPKEWRWAGLGEIIDNIQAGKSIRCDERSPKPNELGIVKVSSVSWGEFKENESKTCFNEGAFNADYIIHENDFLFSRANTIELVGACVIVKAISKRLMLSDKILKIDFSQNYNNFYSLYYLRSFFGRKEIESLATGNQESMRNIGQDRIKQIRIPVCSLREQQAIVQEIETRLSVCDKIGQDIKENLEKAEALRQSILKKAFEGKLLNERELAEVRGAEDWEPAEVLLEKIKAEKAQNGKKIH